MWWGFDSNVAAPDYGVRRGTGALGGFGTVDRHSYEHHEYGSELAGEWGNWRVDVGGNHLIDGALYAACYLTFAEYGDDHGGEPIDVDLVGIGNGNDSESCTDGDIRDGYRNGPGGYKLYARCGGSRVSKHVDDDSVWSQCACDICFVY
jgi:hypothetical protein